jgi:hypothetical protein
MASRKKMTKASTPVVFTRPDQMVVIQIRLKARDAKGKLQYRPGSRAITVGGVSVEDAYERILKAFTAVPQ